jgi:hypothetical protein
VDVPRFTGYLENIFLTPGKLEEKNAKNTGTDGAFTKTDG